MAVRPNAGRGDSPTDHANKRPLSVQLANIVERSTAPQSLPALIVVGDVVA